MRKLIQQLIKIYKGWSMMKNLFSFLLGAALGTLIALLIAPQSGAELRAKFKTYAENDFQKLQTQWKTKLENLNQRLDQLQSMSQVDEVVDVQPEGAVPEIEEASKPA